MSSPQTKLAVIRERWAIGDKRGALRIAARFHDRSLETKQFQRAHDALEHRAFYQQLGLDPDALAAAALATLARKFDLQG
jgi:hypothetical protein